MMTVLLVFPEELVVTGVTTTTTLAVTGAATVATLKVGSAITALVVLLLLPLFLVM